MKAFCNVKMVLLLVVGLLTSIGCKVEKAELDGLIDQQESFTAGSRAENVIISGIVRDPVSGGPLEGVKVALGNAFALTNASGSFSIGLSDTDVEGFSAIVKVTKEGHVDFNFPVSFCSYMDNETVFWDIDLPEISGTLSFSAGESGGGSFFYKGVAYTVAIPANLSGSDITLSVGPTGTVVGKGISGNFAVVGFFLGTSEKAFEFSEAISVSYPVLRSVMNGGIGSIHPLADEVPGTGADRAAQNIKDALAEANGNAAIYISEAYGSADEISAAGDNAVLVSTLEGGHYPGIDVITENDRLEKIDAAGKKVAGQGKGLGIKCGEIPHQATADGG